MVVQNMISVGSIVAFMIALLMLYTPMKNIGNNYTKIQLCFLAMDRVAEVLDREPQIVNKPGAAPFGGVRRGIAYRDVQFSYEPDKPVLKGINLEIKAGQSVAFVGNSGGGKTTLVNLLPRFYDVDSGVIEIDGRDIRDIELDSLRDNIAVVFQDNFLFGGSIRDNIMLGKADASTEEVARAVKAACLDEFIDSLELGLDTQIGERGVMLSGGQKQRVAIARAFLKDAPIVILDEATSALDNQSEAVVQQAIENLMLNKTVLIIAHRLSTVINADRIVVIKDGLMAESGTHNELIAKEGGVYSMLYRTQLT
jgi:subfamily B ATP-binding cassette protein MsbA